jgi:hypothetical protein
MDGGISLDDYFVKFGAYDSSALDYLWKEFYVRVDRKITVGDMDDNVLTAASMDDDASTEIYNKFIQGSNEEAFWASGFSTHDPAAVYTYFTNGSNEDPFKALASTAAANGLIQVYENSTAVNNIESFFDNSGTYKVMFLDEYLSNLSTFDATATAVFLEGDSLETLMEEVHWLILYTGAKPGMVQHYKPYGGSPKTSQETTGETYEVQWFLNPINDEIVDSQEVSE